MLQATDYRAVSPDGNVVLTLSNEKTLTYSVCYQGDTVVFPSPMGFEFVKERPMTGDFEVLGNPSVEQKVEEWTPVVRAKHAHVRIPYTSLVLRLKEKNKDLRRMDVECRVMDEGVAFRYTLYGARRFDFRRIQKELTGFQVSAKASAWMSNFKRTTLRVRRVSISRLL